MDRKKYSAECGVRIIDRYVETLNSKGRRNVIETVAEYTGSWEGLDVIYRYAIHWLYDENSLKIKWYDKLAVNDEARRYEKISIPGDLWDKMKGMAITFLTTQRAQDATDTLMNAIQITPHTESDKVTVTYRTKEWSGFMMIYGKDSNGEIIVFESRNRSALFGERARRGHSRIPRALCELTMDLVVRYYAKIPMTRSNQHALNFTDTPA